MYVLSKMNVANQYFSCVASTFSSFLSSNRRNRVSTAVLILPLTRIPAVTAIVSDCICSFRKVCTPQLCVLTGKYFLFHIIFYKNMRIIIYKTNTELMSSARIITVLHIQRHSPKRIQRNAFWTPLSTVISCNVLLQATATALYNPH
jgi:hypothetical protein